MTEEVHVHAEFVFKQRVQRGYEKLKNVHREQLERFVPVLPRVEVCRLAPKGTPQSPKKSARSTPLGAFLPQGFEQFVEPAATAGIESPDAFSSGDDSGSDGISRRVRPQKGAVPNFRELKKKLIASSPQASAIAGVQHVPTPPPPKPPKAKTNAGGLRALITDNSTLQRLPESPTTGRVDGDALRLLYANGGSTPSERIGGLYSLPLGHLSPARLHVHDIACRRPTPTLPPTVYFPLSPASSQPRHRQKTPAADTREEPSPQLVARQQRERTLYSRIEGYLPLELFDPKPARGPGKAFIKQRERASGAIRWLPCVVLKRDETTLFYCVDTGSGKQRQVCIPL
ncbi:hypothetical protein DIPPA_03003 [Diplonema papillatum]|nr:hypothetical protein DIPPA_03003 [Diplonema papillatum]